MEPSDEAWVVLLSPKGDRRVATDVPEQYPGWTRLTTAVARREVAEAISSDFSLIKESAIMSRMQELIQQFNSISPKPVKRFASVAAGEKRLAALKNGNGASKPTAAPKKRKAAAPKGTGKRGRASTYTHVELLNAEQEGKHFKEGTQRSAVFAYVKSNKRVKLTTLQEKFGDTVRGHIHKLVGLKWVKTVSE